VPYERSLALHGLPLTEARMETNASGHTVLTQWFERGRMEWHPNNPAGFRTLLGLLGTELSQRPSPPRPTATPTATPKPTARPKPTATPRGPVLQYFWPRALPPGLTVQRAASAAHETAFVLTLAASDGGPINVQIRGGVGSEPPPGGQPVTIRGQLGVAFGGPAGTSVYWYEAGHPYVITSGFGLQDILMLSEGLEVLDLKTWRQRLQNS